MDTTKRLRLRFRDSNDRIVSFTITPARVPVNVNDVQEVMDLIIGTDTFYTYTGGSIVKKLDANLHTETVSPVIESFDPPE